MKNINNFPYYIVPVLIIFFVTASCENPLQEDVYSFYSKQNFYKTEADAESAIISIYSELTELYSGLLGLHFIFLPDDQITIHRNPAVIAIDEFNFGPDHVYGFWGQYYKIIQKSNVAINRIPKIDIDEGIKNSLIAEARFLRAYIYFNLVRLWGGVPLSLEEIQNEASTNLPKSSVGEIYSVIIEDLKFAEQYLPTNRSSEAFGRVTKDATKALLADVYLTRENWDMAASKSKEIIDSRRYTLLENFENIFSVDNEDNAEIIFSIVFDGVNIGNPLASFSHAGGSDNVMAFLGAQVWQVDEKSDIWLNWSEEDKRKDFTIYTEYLSKSGEYKSVYNTSRPYPAFGKYNAPNETGVVNCPINPIIYRYADVLLMYAEAISQQSGSPNQDAYEAVNMVRRRAYGQMINEPSSFDLLPGLDATSFRESVIKERSYEFVLEGKRLFDLMRTNKFPQILIDMGKNVTPNATLFPIPTAEIEANSSLTQADQNPGY